MPDIKITYEEMRAKGKQISSYNEILTDTLVSIKNAINNLESQWTSDSSDTIRAKINGMQPKFDNYKSVIDAYAKFLEKTASDYETSDSAVNQNASAFI